jgi:predicted DNA-binding transcriptional regulator AlpA
VSERLLTARAVGELVGLSTEAVLRRWRRGELRGYSLATNVLRFRPEDVHAWLESLARGGPGVEGEVAPVPYQSPGPGPSLTVAPVPVEGGEDAG